MLSAQDYLEALRCYKDKKLNGHERQRYHALLLVNKGYSYRQTADILFVDEETISRWVRGYAEHGLDGLKNHPGWGGEHGQRRLSETEVAQTQSDAGARRNAGHGGGQRVDDPGDSRGD
jgi:transposase